MNITSTQQCNWPVGLQDLFNKASYNKFSFSGHSSRCFPLNARGLSFFNVGYNANGHHQNFQRCGTILCSTTDDSRNPNDSEGSDDKDKLPYEIGGVDNEMLRENLERMVGADDATFSGIDLATLIRNKYGKSYDVQFIKKEFMGKNLLAFNIMWKYVEQLKSNGCKKSFPLTEEEYLLRLDDVVNTLKCWGAVSHIRNSLAKSKERPRIGKAVSIFIDMDESGGRANEWIYK